MKGNILTAKKIALLLCLLFVVVLTAATLWNHIHTSFFVQLLFDDAKEFANTGGITSGFMPIGYSGFLGACVAVGGVGGIPACQALVYGGIVFTVFGFLWLSGIRGAWLLAGTLAAALHPMLVINVWRIHDGNLTVLLLLGFLALGLFSSKSNRLWSWLCFGAITGLMLAVRMNTVLLILPALFLAKAFKKGALFLGGAVLVFMAVNMATTQTPLFVPSHGFYNLFSGANEYSGTFLLKDFSGENSHKLALAARGVSTKSFGDLIAFSPETYKKFALEYIKNNPLEYAKLTGIKAFTLFRPGYHAPENFRWISADGAKRISKIILAAPFFVWLCFAWKTRKEFFEKENFFVFLVMALYILPFLVANADPRYRFPIDICFIADSFRRIRGKKKIS